MPNTIITTDGPPRYWNNIGQYQAAYDTLCAKLVPGEGPAPTTHGELLRLAGNLYYEAFNNGGCNIGPDFKGPHGREAMALLHLLDEYGYGHQVSLYRLQDYIGRHADAEDLHEDASAVWLDPVIDFAVEVAARAEGVSL